ncbi:granulin a [Festucalex cinctus]
MGWACPNCTTVNGRVKQHFVGSTLTRCSTHKQFSVKMPSLAFFCWAMLLLVEGPLDGTCQDGHHPVSSFQCGPSDQGLACADGKHCCQEGHRCSADSMWCIKPLAESAVLCGDKVSECPDGTTCCETPQGTWGCCPLPKAVCCEDKLHCCPAGRLCDIQHSTCVSPEDGDVTPMWEKLPARRRADWENQQANVIFCDDSTFCKDFTTCCKTPTGDWGCCPLSQAVCCHDGKHCCPTDFRCDEKKGMCVKGYMEIPWYPKLPVSASSVLPPKTLVTAAVKPEVVPCDKTSECKDGQTCCKISPTDWGCCPYANAVCCSDMEHCCMAGYRCIAGGKCTLNSNLPWLMSPSNGNKMKELNVV